MHSSLQYEDHEIANPGNGRPPIGSKAPNARNVTNQRTRRAGGVVDEVERSKNCNKSKIRVWVEHVFGVVKRQWGVDKVRTVGLRRTGQARLQP